MNAGKKTWAVVGAAAVLGVSTGVASASLGVNDRAESAQAGKAITVSGDKDAGATPAASPTVDPSPESADSPNASAVDSPAVVQSASSADSPAQAPRRAVSSANSANSPAPAPRPRTNNNDSGNSAASGASGGSADSA